MDMAISDICVSSSGPWEMCVQLYLVPKSLKGVTYSIPKIHFKTFLAQTSSDYTLTLFVFFFITIIFRAVTYSAIRMQTKAMHLYISLSKEVHPEVTPFSSVMGFRVFSNKHWYLYSLPQQKSFPVSIGICAAFLSRRASKNCRKGLEETILG